MPQITTRAIYPTGAGGQEDRTDAALNRGEQLVADELEAAAREVDPRVCAPHPGLLGGERQPPDEVALDLHVVQDAPRPPEATGCCDRRRQDPGVRVDALVRAYRVLEGFAS